MDTTQLIKQYLLKLNSSSVGLLINIAGNYGSFNDFLDENRDKLTDVNFFNQVFMLEEPVYIELEQNVEQMVATTNYNLYIKAYIRKMNLGGVEFDDKYTFSFAINNLIYVAHDDILKFYKQEQEQEQSTRRRRTKANRLSAEKITKVKAFFNLIKKTKTVVDFLNSHTKILSNKLGHEATSSGKATLACMAYYIVKVFLDTYDDSFQGNLIGYIEGSIDLRGLPKSAQLIIAILRIIIKKYLRPVRGMATTKVMKYFVGGNNLFHIDIPQVPSQTFAGFDNLPENFRLGSSDYENSLLEAVFRIIPDGITLTTPNNRTITKRNTYVINNGVVSSNILNNNPLCTVGNFMDGYKNFKCPGNFNDYENQNENLKSGFQVDTDIFRYFLRCKDNGNTTYSVNLNVKLNFNRRQLELYDNFITDTDSDTTIRGRDRLKTKITANYKSILEAANVAKNAFMVLFAEDRDENGIPLLETVPQESANRDEYVRLNALLNTEFFGTTGGRSLYNRFHGTFLAKTTGDTSQYLEANTQKLLGERDIVFKIDNDRPAWAADLIFRRFVKPGLNNVTNVSHSGLIMGDKQFWCTDDQNYSDEDLSIPAWQLIFLVDTFHDYDGNNMVSRFSGCVNELLKLYILAQPMQGGYRTKKRKLRVKSNKKKKTKLRGGAPTTKTGKTTGRGRTGKTMGKRGTSKKTKTKRKKLQRQPTNKNKSKRGPRTTATAIKSESLSEPESMSGSDGNTIYPSETYLQKYPQNLSMQLPLSYLQGSTALSPQSMSEPDLSDSSEKPSTFSFGLPTSVVYDKSAATAATAAATAEEGPQIQEQINSLYEEMSSIMVSFFIMNILDLYLTRSYDNSVNILSIKYILETNSYNENIIDSYNEDFQIFFEKIQEVINDYRMENTIREELTQIANYELKMKLNEMLLNMNQIPESFDSAFELSPMETNYIITTKSDSFYKSQDEAAASDSFFYPNRSMSQDEATPPPTTMPNSFFDIKESTFQPNTRFSNSPDMSL